MARVVVNPEMCPGSHEIELSRRVRLRASQVPAQVLGSQEPAKPMKSPTKPTPSMFLKSVYLLAAAAAGLLTASQAKAATLTFSSPITITSDAVLDLPLSYPGATLIDAKKWGGSATAVTTSGAAQVINFTQGTTA